MLRFHPDENCPTLYGHMTDSRSGLVETDVVMTDKDLKLGIGDFVFYSVLLGRAAMSHISVAIACFITIITVRGWWVMGDGWLWVMDDGWRVDGFAKKRRGACAGI